MTIKAAGSQLKFSEIEAEFGSNPGRSLGRYRSTHPDFTNESPSGSSLSNLPLDTGIPTSGQIKFSNFYGKKLNMVVDYYGDTANLNKQIAGNNTMAATWRYNNQSERVKVVGGYRSRPLGSTNANYALSASDWQGGKKVIINVNQTVGGKKDVAINDVALRTGSWPSGTELQVDIGSSGYLTGGGGNGGGASPGLQGSNGFPGGNGTSALGIEYAATINNGGVIRCGYGGGGGGSGAANDPSDKSDTDYGRSGGGGGGGAGLPAGGGGSGGTGGFNGDPPLNGDPGEAGLLTSGGDGGDAPSFEGANAGGGGAGGDFNDAPASGTTGTQGRPGVGYDAPGTGGPGGSDGKAIYFINATVENNSTFTGNSVGGRNGGTTQGSFT